MANLFKALSRAAATTSASSVYVVPAATTTLINNVVVANTASAAATYSILFNDVAIALNASVPGNDSVILDMKQVLATGQSVKTYASATTVNFHISGLEITA